MLTVRLLDGVAARGEDGDIAPPASRRAWTLLAWLALHPGMHGRNTVAAALWPDVLDSSARQSLRSALWSLRQTLGDSAAQALVTTRDELGLVGADVDLRRFEALLSAGRAEEAVAEGAGELLRGIDDEWALAARDAHRTTVVDLLCELATAAGEQGDHAAAIRHARSAARVDPLSETAARTAMQRLADGGDAAAALAVYDRLAERLRRELRVAPSGETRELAAALRLPAEPPRADPGLVGRDTELATLRAAWERARAGVGGVALVHGGPGIGKTRLADALAATAGGAVVRGGSLDLADAPPFGLWAQIATELLRARPAADERWVADLAPLTPLAGSGPAGLGPELQRLRLFEAVVALVEFVAAAGPLLLVLEDLHAADPSSLELAAYVARRLGGLPVLLLGTRRDTTDAAVAGFEHAVRSRGQLVAELRLEALPDAQVAALARDVAAALDPAAVARIVAAADGNPLLAVESARALAGGQTEPPTGLRAAVTAAAGRLADPGRSLVALLAVAGRPLSITEAAALTPVLGPALDDAVASGLVIETGDRIAFRHSLLRDACYAELAPSERNALHAALGRDNADSAERARHLSAAGDAEGAAGALLAAARQARALGAFPEALRYLELAAAQAPGDPEVLLERGDTEAWRGEAQAAAEAFAAARALLVRRGDGLALVRALLRFAEWHYVPLCRPRVAIAACAEALELIDSAGLDAPAEKITILGIQAWTEGLAGDLDKAEALADQLDAEAPADDPLSRIERARSRVTALARRSRFAEVYPYAWEGGQLAVEIGRPDLAYQLYINGAGAASCAGDRDESLALLDALAGALRDHGVLTLEATTELGRAWVLCREGRLTAARDAATRARRIAERIGYAEQVAEADNELARIELAAGDHAQAEALFGAALAGSGKFSRPMARLGRAEALARLGRADDAEAELRATVLEPVLAGDWPDTLVARLERVQGLVALVRGDRPLARRRLQEAADGWRARLGAGDAGERWAAALTDIGRPVVGTVEPALELAAVQADLDALDAEVELAGDR